MGFGSYDESERENQEIDTDLEEEEAVTTTEYDHDGEIRFEYGDASSDELLETFEEIQEQ